MYLNLLNQIASEMSQQALQAPASASDVEKLRRLSKDDLGCDIPADYVRFLAVTNGVAWNGLTIYATETMPLVGLPNHCVQGFVEANREYRVMRQGDPMHEYLLFGEDSVAFFSLHIPEHSYKVFTIVGMTILETYKTFDSLIVDALKGHL